MLPVAAKILSDNGLVFCLIKPQFEAGREQVGKGGIVKDPAVHEEVIYKVLGFAEECSLHPLELSYSPIRGAKGNIEYILLLSHEKCDNRHNVGAIVEAAHRSQE